MMAELENHQSQLRVPPTPWISRSVPKGNSSPELRIAVDFPAAGGPMIMYHGRAYRAAVPLRPPPSWLVFSLSIDAPSWRRRFSLPSRFSGRTLDFCSSPCSQRDFSRLE